MIRFLIEALAFLSAVLIVAFTVIVFALAAYPPTFNVVREIAHNIETGDWE